MRRLLLLLLIAPIPAFAADPPPPPQLPSVVLIPREQLQIFRHMAGAEPYDKPVPDQNGLTYGQLTNYIENCASLQLPGAVDRGQCGPLSAALAEKKPEPPAGPTPPRPPALMPAPSPR